MHGATMKFIYVHMTWWWEWMFIDVVGVLLVVDCMWSRFLSKRQMYAYYGSLQMSENLYNDFPTLINTSYCPWRWRNWNRCAYVSEPFIFDLGALNTARLARIYSRDEVYFASADTQNIWLTCRRVLQFTDTRSTCILYLRGMPSWRWSFKEKLFYFPTISMENEVCK